MPSGFVVDGAGAAWAALAGVVRHLYAIFVGSGESQVHAAAVFSGACQRHSVVAVPVFVQVA